ncbi:hypothetical protein GCK32_021532 [Trichostrongylus colubriformis]|uniref:Uncharacterized protein n=1 Tax=Trichostrongylus colubriformis TaxID=6319 RepID=A0AAN8IKG3_TRICO
MTLLQSSKGQKTCITINLANSAVVIVYNGGCHCKLPLTMRRLLALYGILVLFTLISAVPVYISAPPQANHRFKRQFGFGMPFGGSYGSASGSSFDFSESESFNTFNTGFNSGFFG